MLSGQSGAPHNVLHDDLKYLDQYKAIVANTAACDCCNFLKSVLALMVANWLAANARAVYKHPENLFGKGGFIPKLERYNDPAPKGNGVDMTGSLLQRIIIECRLTEDQIKKGLDIKYQVPGYIEIEKLLPFPEIPVVVDPESESPGTYTGYLFFPKRGAIQFSPEGFQLWLQLIMMRGKAGTPASAPVRLPKAG